MVTQVLGPRDLNELQAKALQLIGLIYESTFEPERWNDFLKAYAELYPGALQWLWLEDRERADVRVVTGMNSDSSYLPSYEEYYCTKNPWTTSMLGLLTHA
jgi:hypothetical protein